MFGDPFFGAALAQAMVSRSAAACAQHEAPITIDVEARVIEDVPALPAPAREAA